MLGDCLKDINEGVDVVYTESQVIETTNDDELGNEHQTEPCSSINEEAHEEPLGKDDKIIITAHMTQAEQKNEEMETSHVPESLLDISTTPMMVAHATADFIGQQSNNFLKGCKWYLRTCGVIMYPDHCPQGSRWIMHSYLQ